MNIAQILTLKFPTSEWSLIGNEYVDLVWLSGDTKPSEAELKKLWPEVEYELACKEVQDKRQRAYASTSDGLFFGWQRGENTEKEWQDAVQAVKASYPMPSK